MICKYIFFCNKNISSFAFAVQKLLNYFQHKNISVLNIKFVKTVNKPTLNQFLEAMMLWTIGPGSLEYHLFSRIISTKQTVQYPIKISKLASWSSLSTQNEIKYSRLFLQSYTISHNFATCAGINVTKIISLDIHLNIFCISIMGVIFF